MEGRWKQGGRLEGVQIGILRIDEKLFAILTFLGTLLLNTCQLPLPATTTKTRSGGGYEE